MKSDIGDLADRLVDRDEILEGGVAAQLADTGQLRGDPAPPGTDGATNVTGFAG